MRHAMDIAFTEDSTPVMAVTGFIPIDQLEDTTDWSDSDQVVPALVPEPEIVQVMTDIVVETDKAIAVFSYDGTDCYVEYLETRKTTLINTRRGIIVMQPKLGHKALLRENGGDLKNLWDSIKFDSPRYRSHCFAKKKGYHKSWKAKGLSNLARGLSTAS